MGHPKVVNLEQFREYLKKFVREFFEEKNEFSPIIISVLPDGTWSIMDLQDKIRTEEKKEVFITAVKQASKISNVQMLSVISEAWITSYREDEEMPEVMPSKDPRRKKVIFLTFESRIGGTYESDLFFYGVEESNPKKKRLIELDQFHYKNSLAFGILSNILK